MAVFITFLWAALSCALGLAAAQSNVTSDPVTVEFDVVFPGNNTYAPAEVFPIIFALQNLPAARPSIMVSFGWSLVKVDGDYITGENLYAPRADSPDADLDPYYVKLSTTWLNGTESAGTYILTWRFTSGHCTESSLTSTSIEDSLYFTLEPGAQQPDLGADLDTCPAQSATFEISETLPVRWETQFVPPRYVCGLIAESPPPANPCAARLDQAAASSIAAELTASACAIPSSEIVFPATCPPSEQTTGESPASRVPVWTGPGMLMGLILAGFLLYTSC